MVLIRIARNSTFQRGISQIVAKTQTRPLSQQGSQAVDKLRSVLEEYRQKNYAQELPSRFKKELIFAAKRQESDQVSIDGMLRVLQNIGADNRLSSGELESIFQELGGETGEIPSIRMMHII